MSSMSVDPQQQNEWDAETIADLRARLAEVEAENERLRTALEWIVAMRAGDESTWQAGADLIVEAANDALYPGAHTA